MTNYKVLVKDEAESKEVQELFFELGYTWFGGCTKYSKYTNTYISIIGGLLGVGNGSCVDDDKELTIPQLKDLVVLKRNDVNDSNAFCHDNGEHYYITSDGKYYFFLTGGKDEWYESSNDISYLEKHVKPITKEPVMKEFLAKDENGRYFSFNSEYPKASEWIEIPEGAMFATGDDVIFGKNNYYFDNGDWRITDVTVNNAKSLGLIIVWQREIPNDKVATAEVARQEFIGDQPSTPFDTQISGDHYKLLPIQPMKFALANGLDYAQGNVIKYVIRHASKGGKEDLLKAIHNIELMIEHYYGGK